MRNKWDTIWQYIELVMYEMSNFMPIHGRPMSVDTSYSLYSRICKVIQKLHVTKMLCENKVSVFSDLWSERFAWPGKVAQGVLQGNGNPKRAVFCLKFGLTN